MDLSEKIYFVTWHSRCMIRRHVAIESCIFTTKVLSHLMSDLLGLRTVPIGVGTVAINQVALDAVEAGENMEEVEGSASVTCTFRADMRDGGWWGAHLILGVWDDHGHEWLLDGSADQFSLPEKGIIAEPNLMEPPMKLWDWLDTNGTGTWALSNGGAIRYEAHSEDTSYAGTMDWQETAPGEKGYDHYATRVEALLTAFEDVPVLMPNHLPPLPPGVSTRTSDPQVIEAWERRAYVELGHTPQEMEERKVREEQREAIRKAEQTAASMGVTAEEAKKFASMLRQGRALGQAVGRSTFQP